MSEETRLRGAARIVQIGLLVISLSALAWAGDWHRLGTLVCSDCHTIHNSASGQPLRYDGNSQPAENLLRAEDATHLCLACHDGSQAGVPDVVAPVTYVPDPAGGWFAENPIGQSNPGGHDLLPLSPQTAPGGQGSFVLTCLSCHEAHGSDSHRNLLLDPPGNGNTGAVEVIVNQAGGSPPPPASDRLGPSDRPGRAVVISPGSTGTRVSSRYDGSQLRYKSGMSAWCNDCHNNFHGVTGNEEGTGSPWLRHPQSQPIASAQGADFTHWSGALSGRVPVETPDDDLIPSADDRVFCLSCHKAHGSDRPKGLIYADGETRLSTCQQCHNQ